MRRSARIWGVVLVGLAFWFSLELVLCPTFARAADPGDKDKKGDTDDLETLIKNLRHRNVKTRLQAAESLGKKGEEAKPAAKALCHATQDQSPQVGAAALDALQKVSPEIYRPLSTLILDPLTDKRVAAIKELGLMGTDGAPAVPVLVSTLRRELAGRQPPNTFQPSPVRKTRNKVVPSRVAPTNSLRLEKTAEACFNALQALKPQDDESMQMLITIAGPLNKLTVARREAIVTLNIIAGEDESLRKKLVPVLRIGLLEQNDSNLVLACIETLGNYKKLAIEALPQLRNLKLSREESNREAANKAVDQIEN